MFRKLLVIPALVLALLGALAAPAAAHPAPRTLADVRVVPVARVADQGASVVVRVRLRCVPNGSDGIQWEGFVNVDQGDTFGWAGLPLVCDGRPHVVSVVVPVSAEPGTASFTRGRAQADVMLMDENTLTWYAHDVRRVSVVGRRHGGLCH